MPRRKRPPQEAEEPDYFSEAIDEEELNTPALVEPRAKRTRRAAAEPAKPVNKKKKQQEQEPPRRRGRGRPGNRKEKAPLTGGRVPIAMPLSLHLDKESSDYQELFGKKHKNQTKAAKAELAKWKGVQRSKQVEHYWDAMGKTGRAELGSSSVYTATRIKNMVIGIPMPSLALEWLIENDVWPLSLLILLCGKWGTGKSALLYEIFRWFAEFGGGNNWFEVEGKVSPELCLSIMRYLHMEMAPLILTKCTSVDDWQKKLTFFLNRHKKSMEGTAKEPGPGRTFPVCFGVDSIAARGAEETQEKIKEAGSASREFPVGALLNSQWFANMMQEFDDWPFSLVLINHVKQSMEEGGGRRLPGGQFLSFQETLEIETSLWKSKIDTSEFDGIGVKLHCYKNSIGETGRSIKTRLLWWDEPVGKDPRTGQTVYQQQTVWDWGWATTTMLFELSGKYKERLKEAGFVLEATSPKADVESRARSDALGMKKTEFVTFSEFGRRIQESPELCHRIRTALGIARRPVMQGEYLDQRAALEEQLP